MRTESEIKQEIESLEKLLDKVKKKMKSALDEFSYDLYKRDKYETIAKINALKWVIS